MFDVLKKQLAEKKTLSITIRVRPYAPKTIVTGRLGDGTFKVNVAGVPEEGKANVEIRKYLAEEFGVSAENVEILAGGSGRRKTIKITSA